VLQIQQLTTTSSEYIACEEQQQIHGGDAAGGTIGGPGFNRSIPAELLWKGYSTGSLDINKTTGNHVKFTHTNSDGDITTLGTI
jgi:hypothetical protein